MTSPLREMTAAARAMARGDYTRRVRATSRDEVGELARAFNQMAADLAAADRQRRELIANVSHELRTPITALQAVLENIVDGVAEPDPATLRTALRQTEAFNLLERHHRLHRARHRSARRSRCRTSATRASAAARGPRGPTRPRAGRSARAAAVVVVVVVVEEVVVDVGRLTRALTTASLPPPPPKQAVATSATAATGAPTFSKRDARLN